MNTLFQKTITGLGLALSLSLASCENDNVLNPNPAGSARSGAANDVITPGIPQVHKLVKYGNAILTYSDDGRLRKVTTAPTRGSMNAYTNYTYSPGSVRAMSYRESVLVRDETFTLDGSGRCTESVEEGNTLYNGAYFHYTTYWKFTYNAKGQLQQCEDKNSCSRTTAYTFNADGDLDLATTPSKVFSFAYKLPPKGNQQPAGSPLEDDKYPLNVVGVAEHDAYLPIFGKASKHLVKSEMSYHSLVATPVPSYRFFAYSLDADGYVTMQTENTGTNLSGDYKQTVYDYVLTNIGM